MGGTLQWEEFNYISPLKYDVFPHTPASIKSTAERFMQLHVLPMGKDKPGSVWQRSLPDAFRTGAYSDIEIVDYPTKLVYAKAFHQVSVMFMAQMHGFLVKMLEPEEAKEWLECWDQLVEASARGEFYTSFMTPICVVGRKRNV